MDLAGVLAPVPTVFARNGRLAIDGFRPMFAHWAKSPLQSPHKPPSTLLYNFTAVTGVNLSPAAVRPLSEHPNIVGIKESGGDVGQISEFVAGTSPSFSVLAGSSGSFLAALLVGAAGGILALSCVLPHACCRLFHLARERRIDEALILQQRLLPISKLVGSTHGVPGLKAALALVGLDVGSPRSPLMPVSAATVDTLRDALTQLEDVTANLG